MFSKVMGHWSIVVDSEKEPDWDALLEELNNLPNQSTPTCQFCKHSLGCGFIRCYFSGSNYYLKQVKLENTCPNFSYADWTNH